MRNNDLELFLTGKTDVKEFIEQLKSDKNLRDTISRLVPEEARKDRTCSMWKKISFDALERCDFDCLRLLDNTCRFNGSIGDSLELYGRLERIYSYEHPELPYTTKYHDLFGIYLDAIQDCFDGPEVEDIVEQIIQEALDTSTAKTKQRAAAKAKVKEAFHVTDRKRPRWIQGPEWPMGTESPLKFIEQKSFGEEVRYAFQDVTTGEKRIISQWY